MEDTLDRSDFHLPLQFHPNAIQCHPNATREQEKNMVMEPMDFGALKAGGEPHYLSTLFIRRWSYSKQEGCKICLCFLFH